MAIFILIIYLALTYACATHRWRRYKVPKYKAPRWTKPQPAQSVDFDKIVAEREAQRERAWLACMEAKYPIRTLANGKRCIVANGKNNSVSYEIRDGESEVSAYHAFEKMVDLISQGENIYGEF